MMSFPFWRNFEYHLAENEWKNEFDVVIIGAGLTGISTAFWLSELDFIGSIAVLEQKERISDGATGRNGGHCVVSVKEPNCEVYEYECETKRLIEEILEKYQLFSEVEYSKTSMLHVTSTPDVAQKWRSTEFRKGSTFLDASQVKEKTGLDYEGGIWHSNAAQLWPAKLVYALAKICAKKNVKIYTNTRVLSINPKNESAQHQIFTSKGIVRAKKIVFATNAYTSILIPSLRDIIVPTRGQVIATRPLPIIFPFSFTIDDGEYMIQRKNDDRIVFGGFRRAVEGAERNVMDDSVYNPLIHEKIIQFFETKFQQPRKNLIEYEWTGIMGFSVDGYPLVGEFQRDLFIGCGFTGHGMTECFQVGKHLACLLTNRTSSVPSVFDCKRFPNLKIHFQGSK